LFSERTPTADELELYEQFLSTLIMEWLRNFYLYLSCSDFYITENLKGQEN